MKQRSLIMLRPDGIPHKDSILNKLTKFANVVTSKEYYKLPSEIIEEFYEEHKEKDFFPWLVKHHAGKHVEYFILEAKDENSDLYSLIDKAVGPTEARELARQGQDSIRSWSRDDLAQSRVENRMLHNLIHRSKIPEDAEREAKIAFGKALYSI